jgi:3-oxoacyl-[acyl-carrier-protein] synthase II
VIGPSANYTKRCFLSCGVFGHCVGCVLAREVVVTGLGIVSPIGVGPQQVWQSICERRSGVRPLPHLASANWLAPWGGDVADFEPKQLIEPRKSLKVMSREIQLGCAAAELAWQDAGLAGASIDPDRFGVIGGAGLIYCELDELRTPYLAWMNEEDFDLRRWSRQAMGEMYPLWMLKYLPNMPACHIGIRYDARGPSNTISEGDVSSLLAIAEAADVIRRGAADVMIAGGTGSRLNLTDMMWHRGARLAHAASDPAAVCRPFDAGRSGMVYGEGAAQLVLESREHAERRGAQPLARVAGSACRCEASAASQVPTGKAIRRAITAALAAAGLEPADVGHVNAHGNSTREDDSAEAQVIRHVLGDVPVTAPKSFFGNLGPGSGAVELAVSLVAMEHGCLPPTLNYEVPDPECPVNVVTEPLPTDNRTFIKLNHTTVGPAVALAVTAL